MKVYEKNFREMYRQVCLLTDCEFLEKIKPLRIFDYPPDEKIDGYLTYGFIDEGAGFCFKILAGASISEGQIKIEPASYKKTVILNRADVNNAEIKILSEKYAAAFTDRIKIADDSSLVDAAKEQTRLIKNIDAFRHPIFPDDVAVIFYGENLQPEIGWVRCVSAAENFITGTLLQELQQDFDFHKGDKINFGVADFGDEELCVNVR